MADKFLGFLGDLVKPASGGGGNHVYYSVDSSLGEGFIEFLAAANIIKVMKDGVLSFDLPAAFVVRDTSIDTILALGFDKSLKLTNYQTGELVTIEEFVIPFMDQQFTRLTEEEFYMINQLYDCQWHAKCE